jgi:hypothetical protein
MNDQPAPASFIEDDPSGTTLVSSGSPQFRRPMNMTDSDSASRNGDDDDQRQQRLDDISSHMGSVTTHDDDVEPQDDTDEFNLDDIVLHDDLAAGGDPVWPDFQLDSQNTLPLERQMTFNRDGEPHPVPPQHQAPLQYSAPDAELLQHQMPSGQLASVPFTVHAVMLGATSSSHGTVDGRYNLNDWFQRTYTPGYPQGFDRRLVHEETTLTHAVDSSQHVQTTSLPEVQMTATDNTTAPLHPHSLWVHSGNEPDFAAPSIAMSSAPTAFNTQPSANGERTDDQSLILCNQCSAKYEKKRDMLYVAPRDDMVDMLTSQGSLC